MNPYSFNPVLCALIYLAHTNNAADPVRVLFIINIFFIQSVGTVCAGKPDK